MYDYDVVHHTFIIKRHHDHKKDLSYRFKSLNIVEEKLQKFMPPLDTKTKRVIPISHSTLGVSIDEGDLTTFRIDVTLIINEKNRQIIDESVETVIHQLKKLNKPRLVLVWTETRKNNHV